MDFQPLSVCSRLPNFGKFQDKFYILFIYIFLYIYIYFFIYKFPFTKRKINLNNCSNTHRFIVVLVLRWSNRIDDLSMRLQVNKEKFAAKKKILIKKLVNKKNCIKKRSVLESSKKFGQKKCWNINLCFFWVKRSHYSYCKWVSGFYKLEIKLKVLNKILNKIFATH